MNKRIFCKCVAIVLLVLQCTLDGTTVLVLLWQKVTGRPFDFWTLWENNALEIEANKRMYDGCTPLCVETQTVVSFLLFTTLLSGGTLWIL